MSLCRAPMGSGCFFPSWYQVPSCPAFLTVLSDRALQVTSPSGLLQARGPGSGAAVAHIAALPVGCSQRPSSPISRFSFALGSSALMRQHRLQRDILGSNEHVVSMLETPGQGWGRGARSLGRGGFYLRNRIGSFHPPPGNTLGTFYVERSVAPAASQLLQLPFITMKRPDKCQLLQVGTQSVPLNGNGWKATSHKVLKIGAYLG